MAYELIITEKPNAAKKIAAALADGKPVKESLNKVPYYKVTHGKRDIVVGCAVGHLYTVAEHEKSFRYPSFDLEWKPVAEVDKRASHTKAYLQTLKKLAKEADAFTVACDYDIEGEVIGLNIVKYACKQKDAGRMKFSTLTKPDLVKAYEHKSNTLDWGQAHAGETRHFLDWMYGINLSRALMDAFKQRGTFKVMSIGRVQGPALKLVVDREVEIQTFQVKKYWQLELEGHLHQKKILALHQQDKFWKEEEAKDILKKTKGKDGTITRIEQKKQSQAPPNPFDLTTLQTEAYSVFRIKPKDTLTIAQHLYVEGLISYPRTSSQQLPPEIGYTNIMDSLSKDPEYKKLIALLDKSKLTPNNGKKTDPAHPAIYPTGNLGRLKDRDAKIYDLIVKRFLACFGKPAERQTNTLTITVAEEPFIAKGTRTTFPGWHELYTPYVNLEEEELPAAKQDDKVKVKEIRKLDKETQPPKRYTPSSIIRELEKRNLGTKATRAQIIESLYDRGYVINDSLQATDIGLETAKVFERFLPEIMSDELTRHFEEEMDEIQEKKRTPKSVLDEARQELTKILAKFKAQQKEIGKELVTSYKESLDRQSTVGPCPICKKGTLKVKFSPKTKSRFIGCDQYPECKTIFNLPNGSKATVTERVCKDCGYPKVIIQGKRRREVCINPNCKGKRIQDPEVRQEVKEVSQGKVEKECPKCGKPLVVRKSIYGQFYGCSGFPKCRHTEKLADGPLKEDFNKKKKKTKA